MKTITALQCLLALTITVSLSACADKQASFDNARTIETLSTLQNGPQELVRTETKIGQGPEARTGQTVTVHYTGWLYDESAPKNRGKKFDSSLDRGKPFSFTLGQGRVIKGWDQGVVGMKVGGKRTLSIPARLGYGSRGAGASIPPNAPLLFDVELLGVN